ncbi:hypothetical protein M529_03510 [Sphingobium ummariense RL-3]|uniref:Uncharacterized protein n=1 Tax=Sphingobium ummariense RL-3 TaxID=1346791 RepID=T0J9N2_9SPHN|nr:hypothetical protein M529_03510 [Sphingobium ummariense RL-3]
MRGEDNILARIYAAGEASHGVAVELADGDGAASSRAPFENRLLDLIVQTRWQCDINLHL